MKLSNITEKIIFEGLVLANEVIKPVAEKWDDGCIHKTDNLQLTIKSISKRNITDAMAYLYYYDAEGNELGHEFDITDAKILPDNDARFNLMLLPPENFTHSKLEIKAEYEAKNNYLVNIAFAIIVAGLVYGYKLYSGA